MSQVIQQQICASAVQVIEVIKCVTVIIQNVKKLLKWFEIFIDNGCLPRRIHTHAHARARETRHPKRSIR